jgi:hypothetical protein
MGEGCQVRSPFIVFLRQKRKLKSSEREYTRGEMVCEGKTERTASARHPLVRNYLLQLKRHLTVEDGAYMLDGSSAATDRGFLMWNYLYISTEIF